MTEPSRDCWRGKDDAAPFVPGRPAEFPDATSVDELFEAMRCCTLCDLAPGRTQVVVGTGPSPAPLMMIGEAPGADEDAQGVPFVGRSGRLLQRLLDEAGLRREEVFITNIVACRPPGNRSPRVREIRAHAPWLEAQIRLVEPALIVTLGRVALTYFLPEARVTQIHGEEQTIRRSGRAITLLPLFHPSAALRSPSRLPTLEEGFSRIAPLLARLASRRGGGGG